MEILEILTRLAGAFYAVGGIFAIRAMAMSDILDRALGMITMEKEEPRHVLRRWILGIGGTLTGASGVAAALLSFWAVPLFLLNTALQLGWLVWAQFAFHPEDDENAKGRRSTTNAAIGYTAVAALVLALWRWGALEPYDDAMTAGIAAAATLLYLVYLIRCLWWRPNA